MANDFQPEDRNAQNVPAEERIGYCQDCGKPLTTATVRHVGSGVFCEPCLVRRVGAATAGSPYTSGFGATVPPPAEAYTSPLQPPSTHLPNPTLAGFLGLIPGVGAMYNGQFAKGIAHLVIFFVLSSLSDHVNGGFGILVAGWVFYQAFEAYHTAKARLMGTPLPNPLGLNDIGERMGFGKTWTGWQPNPGTQQNPSPSATWTPAPADPATPPPSPAASWSSAPVEPVLAPVPPVPPANWTGYIPPEAFAPPAQQPAPWAAAHNATPYTAPYTAPYTPTYTAAALPYAAVDPATGLPTAPVAPQRHFPVAAIVMIGLGLLALLDTTLHLDLNGSWITAFVLGTVAVWTFAHRVSRMHRDHPEGIHSAGLLACLLCWPSLMLAVLAVLFALQAANLYTLGQTWAVIVIAFGASMLAQRSLQRATAPITAPPFYAPQPVVPVQAGAAAQPVAPIHPDEDGGQR
jgi:TM2 domain-containing membrane protein YozV